MARKEEFEIIVSPDGQIKVKAVGFKGTECVKPLKEISEVIAPGVQPIREEKLTDYYQVEEKKKKITGESKE